MSERKDPGRRKWTGVEYLGIFLVLSSLASLLFWPHALAGLFDAIIKKVFPIVVDIFLTGEVGIAVIVSVIVGRMLERLGFTDALFRVFAPVMKWLSINPAVIIPSVYNILGDINAAGRIAGPILMRAKATKAEQKIAVATMIQSQQSFATFMIGLIALAATGAAVFPVVLLSIFVPLILVPWLLSKTIYRDTRTVELEELPRFTPGTAYLKTVFDAAKEGTELLLLVIIPAVAVVFGVIGLLEYIGVWQPIENAFTLLLSALSIEPATGMLSLLASPTLAMAELQKIAASIDPRLAVGSFVLASSGLPLSVIFGQVPATWAAHSDLTEREAMAAAVIGMLMRLVTAFVIGYFVTPWVV
ncbi:MULTISPECIES: hypothetical protein [Brevibacillus]|jgi:hypothetical protein|uniref:hypothetical protein n=1 Tax=Brevibacillus TaxID=55080 RepID=UPI00046820DC|nr:hypothetical protein [Brevibacillus borstelensis]KKX54117.1 membrane protein [Brevibacillus borstelensis cifa_chp40]MCC0564278.1 hypothetical protein [Brevibacillus borstelensis]NOU54023.1 hypothetical protein [Brevibacillus borstelensis]